MTIANLSAPIPRLIRCRDREVTLEHLAPKMLGIIWENGAASFDSVSFETSLLSVIVDNVVKLSAFRVNEVVVGLHVYECLRKRSVKVFSCHLSDRAFTVGEEWKYLDGSCTILSWKRGLWEMRILSHAAETRSVANSLAEGLVCGNA